MYNYTLKFCRVCLQNLSIVSFAYDKNAHVCLIYSINVEKDYNGPYEYSTITNVMTH